MLWTKCWPIFCVICKRLPVSEMAVVSWSAEQQRLLQAMGYQVFRQVHAAVGFAPVSETTSLPDQRSAANAHSMQPRFALASFPATAESAAQQMLVAVLRAAGLNLNGVELLLAGSTESDVVLPPLDLLLNDAATRRGLWPQLRRLRRGLVESTPR